MEKKLTAAGRSFKGDPYCKRGHLKVLGRQCQECNKIRCARHFAANQEQHRVKASEWYYANKQYANERNSQYQKENREQVYAKQKEWKDRNREHVNAESRKRYQNIKEVHAKRVRSWKDRNRDVWREINNAAKSRRRARINESLGSHTGAEWRVILAEFKHRCAYAERGGCGGSLEKDHIVPLAAGGSDMAVNLQPLCRKHNAAKSATVAEGTQLGIFDRIKETVNNG